MSKAVQAWPWPIMFALEWISSRSWRQTWGEIEREKEKNIFWAKERRAASWKRRRRSTSRRWGWTWTTRTPRAAAHTKCGEPDESLQVPKKWVAEENYEDDSKARLEWVRMVDQDADRLSAKCPQLLDCFTSIFDHPLHISWANVCQLNKKRSVPANPVLTSLPPPTYVYLLKIWTQLAVLWRIWTPLVVLWRIWTPPLVVWKRLLVNLLQFLAWCKLSCYLDLN